MAKDKLLRWARFYDGGVELSGDARTIGNLPWIYDIGELTALNTQVKYSMVSSGLQMGIEGFQCLVNDTTTTGSHSVLSSAPNSTQASLLIGSAAEPVVGDMAYSIPGLQTGEARMFDNGIAALTADYAIDATQSVSSILVPWGVVINPDTSLSATTNQSSVDNDAGSSNGGHAILHVIASDGGTWGFKVQHSTNDADWSDLITFTADGSAIAGELGTASGTVNQYVRFQATRTSGTVTAVCVFVRY